MLNLGILPTGGVTNLNLITPSVSLVLGTQAEAEPGVIHGEAVTPPPLGGEYSASSEDVPVPLPSSPALAQGSAEGALALLATEQTKKRR